MIKNPVLFPISPSIQVRKIVTKIEDCSGYAGSAACSTRCPLPHRFSAHIVNSIELEAVLVWA